MESKRAKKVAEKSHRRVCLFAKVSEKTAMDISDFEMYFQRSDQRIQRETFQAIRAL